MKLIFDSGKATVAYINPSTALHFFIDRDGEVIFLERSTSPRTWSEVVERKARRRAAS